MFYETLNTFAGDVSLVGNYYKTKYHTEDPKFKDICKEYVAMLNKMPDNNLTLCSRYANEENSLFEFVTYEDAPNEYKKYTIPYPSYTGSPYLVRGRFLVKYKDAYFVDGYIKLGLIFDNKNKYDLLDNDNICVYTYVDFSFKDQNENRYNQGSCSSIENYDQIYKNGKE
jgi:hypothetical protein